MLSGKIKYYLFFTIIFGIYLVINASIVNNCIFIADDLSVIFFSNLNPFPINSYWENGLQQLIPGLQMEAVHYRPLTSFFTHLSFLIFGLNPFYWSALSQVIHLMNFIVLIFIFFKIQKILEVKKKWLCFIVPVFYLFYPGNLTNLAWLAARTDLIVIFFCLTSFYFSLKYVQSKKIPHLMFSSLLFFLGTLTKENALCWFIVEFMLLWQIYFLSNQSSAIFTALIKLLNAKITACLAYVFCGSILASIDTKSIIGNVKFFAFTPVYLKSLLFTLLPVDSGTFIYTFADSKINFILLYVVYFAALIIILYVIFRCKNFVKMFLIAFVISLSSLSFYIIAGGGTYRLFVLTFVSLIIFGFNLLTVKNNLYKNILFKIASVVVLIFFIYGSFKISGYWITNYKLQNESLESLAQIYDKGNDNIVLNYPHALGQSYCYSDIGIYLYYKMTGTIGRFNNITGLTAISSHESGHYLKGGIIEENNNSFVISSEYNDTYFSSKPFFTEKSSLGEKQTNFNNFSFEVLRLNSFSKPLSLKIEQLSIPAHPVNLIKFANGKFEKF